ncbi:MarR family transcriptional regulator, partial [Mycobacterium sp. ITM-2017-0098]
MEGHASVSRPALFTPSATEAAELDTLTVGRTHLLDTLSDRITSSA